jgi:hypothetical protein
MDFADINELGSAQIIKKTLGKGLNPGEMGIVLSGAGGGKTACLTHMALEQLLNGLTVLHVCIDEKVETIKVWYQELLKNVCAAQPALNYKQLQQQLEPMRFILAYLKDAFSPEKLEQSYQNLKEQAQFKPSLVIMDGLDFDRVTRPTIEALQLFSQKHQVPMWMSARTHRHITTTNDRGVPYPCHEMDDLFRAIILLEPGQEANRLVVIKHGDQYMPAYSPVYLNPQTFLLQ